MDGWVAIAIAVPCTFAASWLGGGLHVRLASNHLRVQLLLSFVAGLMLGMALLHLLPHAIVEIGSVDRAIYAMLGGILGIFFLIRFLHVHTHEPGVACADDHAEGGHDHSHQSARVRWLALLTGLGIHSSVDGVAIASAVRAGAEHGHALAGLPVLIVVLLHKPIDAVSLTGTMAASGESVARRRVINLVFACVTPAAAVAAYLGLSAAGAGAGYAMAFAAGAFVCLSLADLMPEVQFHSHHRVRLTTALLLGVGLAAVLGFVEGENHGHGNAHIHEGHAHD